MEDCCTPTCVQPMEFKFNCPAAKCSDLDQLQSSRHLTVKNIQQRCFTPNLDGFKSPGMSPIDDAIIQSVENPNTPMLHTSLNPLDHLKSVKFSYNASSSFHKYDDPDNNSIPQIVISDTNLNNVLNNTLNVALLLKSVGLEEYSDKFESCGITLEQFLNIQKKELDAIGLNSDEHCNIIMDFLTKLRSN
ncbi:protein matrimony [Teleopsis dalmanni]|uniref:protein matrimony n=1 Tax=Teleopsis dalmanni TaxID=139649 RepID=UPI0018CF7ABD|nr:protein matrimony [Teleopsis dalmanni]